MLLRPGGNDFTFPDDQCIGWRDENGEYENNRASHEDLLHGIRLELLLSRKSLEFDRLLIVGNYLFFSVINIQFTRGIGRPSGNLFEYHFLFEE